MTPLKLVALDEQDLEIISAHVQDAVLKVGDLDYSASAGRFVAAMNRFVWEAPRRLFQSRNERRNSVLDFGRVVSVKLSGIDRTKRDDVLSLLALRFYASEAPAGTIDLIFSGGGVVKLEVECIEARLSDLGAAWDATSRPQHRT